MTKYLSTILATLALIVAIGVAVSSGEGSKVNLSGTTNFDALTLDNGNLTVSSGVVSITSTGTTTLDLKTTSSTQGICMEFHATSTDTLLNQTYAATSSTALSALRIAPVYAYGACP